MSSRNQGRRSDMAVNKSLQETPNPPCGFGATELRRYVGRPKPVYLVMRLRNAA